MPTEVARPRAGDVPRFTISYDRLVERGLWVFVACGAMALFEPSPYEIVSFVAIPLWFMGGFKVHRFALPLIALVFLYTLGGFISLIPHIDEHDPTQFMLQSVYLDTTLVFFALLLAERTLVRAEICLRAFTASTIYAAILGIAGYFNVGGTQGVFTLYGRASGTFKDPNVFGSYLVLGALYLMQQLILGRTRRPVLTALLLLIQVAGIFLSLSRGSWGAFLIASAMMVTLTYLSNREPRIRRRIVTTLIVTSVLAGVGLACLLSLESIRAIFLQRASGLQDYDQGETGRFGNQLHSIALLLDQVNGFGPVRFRLIFGEDPHNSYVNAFASYGWLGGFSFLLLVGLTMYVGFRLCLSRSPFDRIAHLFWPTLFVFLMQGFQIDIDHWRHLYMTLGAVWGIETARVRWQAEQVARPATPNVTHPGFPIGKRPAGNAFSSAPTS